MANELHFHNSFAFWINRLSNTLQDTFNQQLKAYDITWPQWLVLNVLHQQMASTPAQLAAHMGIDRSGVTRLLDRLETKNFIEREHDKLDRRSVIIHLTRHGRTMMDEINRAAYEHQQAFLADLHSSERRGLKGELQKMLKTNGVETSGVWQRID